MKREIRVLGVDDSPFSKSDKESLVIGTVLRGSGLVEGILSTKVHVDGSDSTDKLVSMVNSSKFKKQLRCIMLDGIALAGFNVIDINKLNRKTDIPVIVVIRKMPDIKKIKKTLAKLGMEQKIKLIDAAGDVVKKGNIYIQYSGLASDKVSEMIEISRYYSYIPEAIRISHMIASGVHYGESRGKP
ncbi:MAG: DUF99 family protein [Nanoarchaeota archaeon]|nr:DUF99 family protein [Nanoarchaeota archaeon]MBU1704416.1 DUF99 family protein [Nanoarchaeota archaeon]